MTDFVTTNHLDFASDAIDIEDHLLDVEDGGDNDLHLSPKQEQQRKATSLTGMEKPDSAEHYTEEDFAYMYQQGMTLQRLSICDSARMIVKNWVYDLKGNKILTRVDYLEELPSAEALAKAFTKEQWEEFLPDIVTRFEQNKEEYIQYLYDENHYNNTPRTKPDIRENLNYWIDRDDGNLGDLECRKWLELHLSYLNTALRLEIAPETKRSIKEALTTWPEIVVEETDADDPLGVVPDGADLLTGPTDEKYPPIVKRILDAIDGNQADRVERLITNILPEKLYPAAVDALMQKIEGKDVGGYQQRQAIRGLFLIGPPATDKATDPLITILNDSANENWMVAAKYLGKLNVERAIPDLVTMLLSSTSRFVREEAASALGYMDPPEGSGVVDALIEALRDDAPSVRGFSLQALGQIGRPLAEKAIPVIIDLAKGDPETSVIDSARTVLLIYFGITEADYASYGQAEKVARLQEIIEHINTNFGEAKISFKTEKAVLADESKAELLALSLYLEENKNIIQDSDLRIDVTCFVPQGGDDGFNIRFADARAQVTRLNLLTNDSVALPASFETNIVAQPLKHDQLPYDERYPNGGILIHASLEGAEAVEPTPEVERYLIDDTDKAFLLAKYAASLMLSSEMFEFKDRIGSRPTFNPRVHDRGAYMALSPEDQEAYIKRLEDNNEELRILPNSFYVRVDYTFTDNQNHLGRELQFESSGYLHSSQPWPRLQEYYDTCQTFYDEGSDARKWYTNADRDRHYSQNFVRSTLRPNGYKSEEVVTNQGRVALADVVWDPNDNDANVPTAQTPRDVVPVDSPEVADAFVRDVFMKKMREDMSDFDEYIGPYEFTVVKILTANEYNALETTDIKRNLCVDLATLFSEEETSGYEIQEGQFYVWTRFVFTDTQRYGAQNPSFSITNPFVLDEREDWNTLVAYYNNDETTGTWNYWYQDIDGDGFGNEDLNIYSNLGPRYYIKKEVSEPFDCDDSNASIGECVDAPPPPPELIPITSEKAAEDFVRKALVQKGADEMTDFWERIGSELDFSIKIIPASNYYKNHGTPSFETTELMFRDISEFATAESYDKYEIPEDKWFARVGVSFTDTQNHTADNNVEFDLNDIFHPESENTWRDIKAYYNQAQSPPDSWPVWYKDIDGDGYGNKDVTIRSNLTPVGYASEAEEMTALEEQEAALFAGRGEHMGDQGAGEAVGDTPPTTSRNSLPESKQISFEPGRLLLDDVSAIGPYVDQIETYLEAHELEKVTITLRGTSLEREEHTYGTSFTRDINKIFRMENGDQIFTEEMYTTSDTIQGESGAQTGGLRTVPGFVPKARANYIRELILQEIGESYRRRLKWKILDGKTAETTYVRVIPQDSLTASQAPPTPPPPIEPSDDAIRRSSEVLIMEGWNPMEMRRRDVRPGQYYLDRDGDGKPGTTPFQKVTGDGVQTMSFPKGAHRRTSEPRDDSPHFDSNDRNYEIQ